MRIPARLLASESRQCGLIGFISAQAASSQAQGTWASARKAPAECSEVTVAALGENAHVIGDYNGATEASSCWPDFRHCAGAASGSARTPFEARVGDG
jgi:hypothetical protein